MLSAGWWREPDDLDDVQQVVAALPQDGKYLITGKPGSGKTNLLVLRAVYLIRANLPDVKVLTWTRLINEFIATGTARHGLETGRELQTFKSWAQSALQDVGMDIVLTGEFADQIHQITRALQSAEEALFMYDGMMLDEVQDYSSGLVRLLAALSNRVFFVRDENQRIYDAHGGMDAARTLVDRVLPLPWHYRNGRRICAVAEAIMSEDDYVSTSRYPEERLPSRVFLRQHADLDEQIEAVKVELRGQLRSYPNELLGVMVPRQPHLRDVVEALRDSDLEERCQFQTREELYSSLDDDKPIIVSTVHAAKGVEYRAAHLVAMEGITDFPREKRRNLAYTGVTRAKTTLHGYYSGSIQSWLRSAFLKGDDPPNTPQLPDLFG